MQMHRNGKFIQRTDYWYVSFWLKDFGFFNNDRSGLVQLLLDEFGREAASFWATRGNIIMFEVLDFEVDRFVEAVYAYSRRRKKRKPKLILACAYDYNEDPLTIGATHWNKTLEWPKREQGLRKMRNRLIKEAHNK